MALETNSLERWLSVEYLSIGDVRPDPRNARKHTAKQISKLAKIIAELGWSAPIIIDEAATILAGHARHQAAVALGIEQVPCVRLSHLTPAQKRALAIADNAMTDASSWDDDALRSLVIELGDLDFDLELTGLEMGVIDVLIDGPAAAVADSADSFELPGAMPTVSRPGDLWLLGVHRLFCGNALDASPYERLLGDERARLIFSDPPYNVRIGRHVSGLGSHRHREFAMASGEMSDGEFAVFLTTFMRHLVSFSVDGSIHYICIDWRHVRALLEAGAGCYRELKNLCAWVKTNGGMGSLYRSRHELVAVFKNGDAPHTNNVSLGVHGRYRTNVWEYAGANAFSATRNRDLADHPTVKPIALIADAIKDCSKRGDLVLDPFLGSGTTLLAAERTKRLGRGIEIDPSYVDVAVRRWQEMTGGAATLEGDGRTFAEIAEDRQAHEPGDTPSDEEG